MRSSRFSSMGNLLNPGKVAKDAFIPNRSASAFRPPRQGVAIRFGFVVYDLQLAVEIDFRNDSFFLIFDDAAPPCDKDFLPRFQFVGPPATCPEGFRCLEKASRIGDENEESLQLGVRKLRLKNTVPANPGELFAGRFQRRFVRGAGHASAP